MEALLKPVQKPQNEPRRNTFEGVDLVAAGRKGGRASGIRRRLAKQRAIEAAIFDRSKNGYALLKLAEREERRNRELDRARIEADSFVCRLMDDADREREIIAGLLEQARALEAQVAALEQRRAQLDSDDALDALLAELGEPRIEQACERLGWYDGDGDE